MKPVFQSTFGFPKGDCFSAVLASILEVPLEIVPRFCDHPDEDWTPLINDWLRPRGLYYVVFQWNDYLNEIIVGNGGIYELSGRSPRGDHYHAVVGLGGLIIHDPHPDGRGIRPHTDEYPWIAGLLVPFDPTKVETP